MDLKKLGTSIMNNLPTARGYLKFLDIQEGMLVIQGWILHPDIAMDSFKLVVDGNVIHEAPLIESVGIAKTFHLSSMPNVPSLKLPWPARKSRGYSIS
jgi:hypothetical protein